MKPIYKRSLKVAAAVLATPIVLLVLLAVLLYIPPVQKLGGKEGCCLCFRVYRHECVGGACAP